MNFLPELASLIRKKFGLGFIPLHEPRFMGNEKKYVLNAIDSTFVSSVGEYVNLFEKKIAEFTGSKYAIATASGTSALHISLLIAGVTKKTEVITQALSFVATTNAISYCGAKPIFIDVNKSTLGLCPKKVLTFLENETYQTEEGCFNRQSNAKITAIVPMHTFGHSCQMDKLIEVAKKFNIPVVEDAAESLGSYYKNKHTGTFGVAGAFSFNGNKIITCGGGGVIVTDDDNLAKIAKHLTTTAKIPHAWEYKHDQIGYNYRMPNLNAALICAQLEELPNIIENKRKLASEYIEFGKVHNIQFIQEPENCKSNYWLNTICLKDDTQREEVLKKLNDQDIMCRPAWNLLHKMPMFKDCQTDNLEISKWLEKKIINVPSSTIINDW